VVEGRALIAGSHDTVKLARKLRSEMTLPEGKLWIELRRRPGGYKFRRQHPAGQFVLDFYCAAVRLAIEVDGQAHDGAVAVVRDSRRSAWLRARGIATTRIPASHVLQNIEAVVMRLVEICDERRATRACSPLHHPADGPPPRIGEEG
jgi:very-short-patch-repair endonuclease